MKYTVINIYTGTVFNSKLCLVCTNNAHLSNPEAFIDQVWVHFECSHNALLHQEGET